MTHLLQQIREDVESQTDYLLRMARISHLKAHLVKLQVEADSIKLIDLPLWYVGGRDPSFNDKWGQPIWILLREDANPEVFQWVCNNAYRAQHAPAHPIYPAFYGEGYLIGNKATTPKKYFRCSSPYHGNGSPNGVDFYREYLSRHLGPICWVQLPKEDINGRYICR